MAIFCVLYLMLLLPCRLAQVEVVACLCTLISFLRSDFHQSHPQKYFNVLSNSCNFYLFQAIGLKLLNGYGMTESSPVTAARRAHLNVRPLPIILLEMPFCAVKLLFFTSLTWSDQLKWIFNNWFVGLPAL